MVAGEQGGSDSRRISRDGRRLVTFVKVAALVLKKDFAIELKAAYPLHDPVFAVSCVLIFAMAFVKEGTPIEGAAPVFSGLRCCLRATWRSVDVRTRALQRDASALLLAPTLGLPSTSENCWGSSCCFRQSSSW